jgi:nucleotide-binding universal stress UspA family protein
MKRILVAIDGSSRAPYVLQTAATIAKQAGAKLIVLRAVGILPELPAEVLLDSPDHVAQIALKLTRTAVETAVKSLPPELVDRIEAKIGSPWNVICDLATSEKVDLIVVGTHGYSGIDHLLGTTAARIVNHAPCSVLIAREPKPA